MIAIITETFIWSIPEEKKELMEYLYKNPSIQINNHTEKVITVNKYTHICEKEEEKLKVEEYKEEDFYDELPFWMKEEDPDV